MLGRVGRFSAMLFTTHINVTAFAQNEQRQTGKHRKTNHNFPHTHSLKKRPRTTMVRGR